jgi:hypothetical protein
MPEQAILSATPSKPATAVAKVARLRCRVHYQVAGAGNAPAQALAAPDRLATLHADQETVLGPLVAFDVMAPEMPGGCAS